MNIQLDSYPIMITIVLSFEIFIRGGSYQDSLKWLGGKINF